MYSKLDELEKEYGARLEAAHILKPYGEARSILERILETWQDLDNHRQDIEAAFALRQQHVPVDRIFGASRFCGLSFALSDKVFKPCPETEEVVRCTLSCCAERRQQAIRILDLGTGTGCILLALLHSLPQATGVGIDLDPAILAVARKNAEALGLPERAEWRVGNWSRALDESFDVIVSNPPRVATKDIPFLIPEMRDHDPAVAVDGGDDGLDFYRRLAEDFDRLSAQDGFCVCQVGPRYAAPAERIFRKAGFAHTSMNQDHAGMPCCLTVKKKAAAGQWIRKLVRKIENRLPHPLKE